MSAYCVSSVENRKDSYHRKLRMAFQEACRRLNVGDSEISILDFKTNRHFVINDTTTVSAVERYLTYGERAEVK